MGFLLTEICAATGGRMAAGSARVCQGVAIDSRRVRPGDLFVAIRGERFDGHDFIPAAAGAGAAAVLASRPVEVPPDCGLVLVDDTVVALGALAHHHRRHFSLPVAAVTGSTGKTSTKELIAAIGRVGHRVAKTSGNQNNEIGLPLTLLALSAEDELLVLEMGMRGSGQIAALAALAEPQIGIVTNIGLTHLELLGTQEAIAAAKGELVASLPATGTAILNADDPRCLALAARTAARVLTFGLGPEADVRATQLELGEEDANFILTAPGWPPFAVSLAVPGRHQVLNALAAAAAALALGYRTDEVRTAFANFGLERGRGAAILAAGGWVVIDDTYNANPASMQAALAVLAAKNGGGRRMAVLGDMLELGQAASASHRAIGAAAAAAGLSFLLTVGELGEEIGAGAVSAGLPATMLRHFREKGGLLAHLRSMVRPGDIILVKGSRGMRMEEIVDGLLDS